MARRRRRWDANGENEPAPVRRYAAITRCVAIGLARPIDQRHGVCATQLARWSLRNGARSYNHDATGPHIDLAYHLVGHFIADPTELGTVLPVVGFDRNSESFPRAPHVQPYGNRTARANAGYPARRPLDIGGKHLAAAI